ncbi:uncharacterized protein ANIA_10850 [Aspergillus nidulans FGSC A4]|uniref:Uncharacterized protein n=1 Tax=Emericella nidulans (strain FGSC A4 / ATCC 38163 / CBS 112.46 / NRRL 194 / M139) TaxID=227321 RepID=C8V1P6_EMENI|nr:hypothetical protein [Aspergillus nidulans FGSC A4]CBF71295.1 TPA: hypothetical protein ANIA_10850 [Aspergillus nidulans FGSC A4]
MIAVKRSTAGFMPMLLMVKVPPWYSSGLSLLSRARLPRSLTWLEMLERPRPWAFFTIGVIRPTGVATATLMSTLLCWRITTWPFSSVQLEFTWGTLRRAAAQALMRKSLTESLYLPSEEAFSACRSFRSLVTDRVVETKK